MTCDSTNNRSNEKTKTAIDESSTSHGNMDGTCPSCGHPINCQDPKKVQASSVQDLPGLPAGMKFDPSDLELLQHLEGRVRLDYQKLHPLIDEFIVMIEGDDGICYTHPEKLPGVRKDGVVRHFFHRPSKAYTTGTRKRRKVQSTEADGGETRWHKTGKTRPILINGKLKGHKKILVLYTNYGKRKKPEKTNWVMHQYHLGNHEDEKEGELVVSKIFYQTQPRQCGASMIKGSPPPPAMDHVRRSHLTPNSNCVEYYDSSLVSFEHRRSIAHVLPNFHVHDSDSFVS